MAFPDTAVKNFTHRAAAAAALSAQTRAQNVTGNASACATGNASDGGKDVGRGLSPSSHFSLAVKKPLLTGKPILLSIQEIKMSATIVRY